jgi:hypothetical protein
MSDVVCAFTHPCLRQLPTNTEAPELEELFSKFGVLQEVFIVRDKKTRAHKGSLFAKPLVTRR